jgi:NADH dehydrogenase
VDEFFRVQGMDGVLALGDIAAVPNEATGEFDPPTCQHALRQARRLARNLKGSEKPYSFKSLGSMATLGRRHGIATVGAMRLRGIVGWGVARGYHLMALPFVARRARVLADWTVAACFRRDVVELTP